MDARVFDVLVRGAAQACTRRRAVVGLAAALLGLPAAERAAVSAVSAGCSKKGDNCFTNYACCEGLKCRIARGDEYGQCVNKNDSNRRCRDDEDCRRGERCKRNRCKNRNRRNGEGNKGDRCNNDNDCRSGLRCERDRCKNDGRCGREGDRCRRNGDCCNAMTCNRDDGRCRR
ncbi:MAG: hypothetical protein ACKOWF_03735 [Chloroflexota bacterium]